MIAIVGHRGARNLWPENSLSGFRKTVALPIEAIEFDVHATRDGQLVVIHDATLQRTAQGHGAIRDLDAVQVLATALKASDDAAGERECVPSLDAVLDVLGPSALELHVEIKADALGEVADGTLDRVIETVRRHGVGPRCILTCFVPEVLDRVRARWPEARLLASLDLRAAEMMGGVARALERYAAMRDCIVAVERNLLEASWSACLSALGSQRLGVWVVNEPDELDRWIAMPLRQVTTDRPDLALTARSRTLGSARASA